MKVNTPPHQAHLISAAFVKHEALIALANGCVNARPDQRERMVNLGVLETLTADLEHLPTPVLKQVLIALHRLLEFGNEVQAKGEDNPVMARLERFNIGKKLEELQNHEDEGVYRAVFGLLQEHFDTGTQAQSII